tara:strand:- start:9 stop:512 length:504 start_codon:yes stop_codon:yes gene_type:complete
MIVDIKVTKDFINQRDARAEKYNPRGRTFEQLKLDIECEIFEWWMINKGTWKDHDAWQVDGIDQIWGNIDVKFIKTWYNIPCQKMVYLLKQRELTDAFLFCEWNQRPQRLLVTDDVVKVNPLGILEYWELLDIIKPSKYNGFYADIRKYLNSTPNTSKFQAEEKGTK